MKNLLEYIIKGLVDNPQEVKIEETSGNEETTLRLATSPTDMGKVIGKNGQIIRAIRILVRTCAFRKGERVQVILEDTNPKEPA